MSKADFITTLIVIATFALIATVIYNNVSERIEPPESRLNQTFLLEPPLKSVTLYYSEPGQKEFRIIPKKEYVGTKVSVVEYDFRKIEGKRPEKKDCMMMKYLQH
jgi:hypothetical protein